jgi:hypothetical protein
MARMDGTGPESKGKGTGRRLGNCGSNSSEEVTGKPGKGKGLRRQAGGGKGKGKRLRSGQQ